MRLISSIFLLIVVAGCTVETPKRKIVLNKGTLVKGDNQQVFDPKVDILFVVDDSTSMSDHQARLAENVELFTDELKKNKILDWQVGVTTMLIDGFNAGELVSTHGNPLVITREMRNATEMLAQNLMFGTRSGSIESAFLPVERALTDPLRSGLNRGFLRTNAHLAIIFITDAEDQSDILPEEMYEFLLNLKLSKDSFSAYAALVPSNVRHEDCSRDDRNVKPRKIEEFLKIVRDRGNGVKNYFSLCDPEYGLELSKLGEDLVQKISRYMPLVKRPVRESIIVRYGKQVIPYDPDRGYSFDPTKNALIFGPQLELIDQGPNTRMEVFFYEADPI